MDGSQRTGLNVQGVFKEWEERRERKGMTSKEAIQRGRLERGQIGPAGHAELSGFHAKTNGERCDLSRGMP